MVLWFSGTGNSQYLANEIAKELGQEVVSIFDKIKNQDYSPINSADSMIFCVPTYAWRIPIVVSDWIEKTEFTGNKNAYFVMSCGGEISNAEKYIKKLCAKKGFKYMGVKEIVMPENYIAMFGAPEEDEARDIIRKVAPLIHSVVQNIKSGEPIKAPKASAIDKLKSGIVNTAFYSICVKDKKFYVTEGCIGCGACVKLCPLNNITMDDGKPRWNGNCTHCMSCICKCPSSAIEYGSKSLNQPRYTCPKID